MRVTSKQIGQWGSYGDRIDSYDDGLDIHRIGEMLNGDVHLKQYVKNLMPTAVAMRTKPFGQFDVDIGFVDENGTIVGTMDVERWGKWQEEWPKYYAYISFLTRKDKFLNEKVPFIMGYFSYMRDRLLLVERCHILDTKPMDKEFASGAGIDNIRPVPFKYGHIFGIHVTDKEKKLFNYAG